MIRWSYVVPRSVLAAGLALFLWLGVDPLVRRTLVSSGQAATGAKVDIGDVDTSVINGTIRLSNIQIANPNAPDKNLIEASEAVLDIETSSLLKRKLVVTEGRLSGVRLNTDRTTSGALDPSEHNEFAQRIAREGLQRLKHFTIEAGKDIADKSETIALSKELIRRWPAECERLLAEAESLQTRVKNLRKLVENPDPNPLRNIEASRHALAEIESLQRDFQQLRSDVENLPRRARVDREALIAAKGRDEQAIRDLGQLAKLDPDALALYLLGPEQATRLQTVLQWIDWGRRLLPNNQDAAWHPQRMRGFDVAFVTPASSPDLLIRSLAIDGTGTIDDRPFSFAGSAKHLTGQPKLHNQPASFHFCTHGVVELQVDATVDRRTELPHDRIVVQCPSLPQPQRVLGDTDQLALVVPPGDLRLAIEVDLCRGEIDGRLVVTQDTRQMHCKIGESYGGDRLAQRLDRALQQIPQVEAVVELTGTIEQPIWKLRSEIGGQLATACEQVFYEELELRRDELIVQLNGYLDDQLAQFNGFLAAKQSEIAQRLQLSDQDIAALQQRVAGRLGVPTRLSRDNLPIGDLFRR